MHLKLCTCLSIILCFICTTMPAYAFKTKMHIRTANMAILDAMDGAICLPGLTKNQAAEGELPPQVPLGNTLLQHFFSSLDEQGDPQTSYRTYLLQYAPYIRAGAIGPDGFPDMISGQIFVHANNSAPYECLEFGDDGECTSFHTRDGSTSTLPDTILSKVSGLTGLVDLVYKYHPEFNGKSYFGNTFAGGPQWRSVDWAHEVMFRALTYNDDKLLRDDGSKNLSLSKSDYDVLMEEKRGAVAFALGYFMHMIGDGNIHAVINNLVAMPWSYFGTRMPDNPVYRPLSGVQEELQHMGFERYFSELYAPGSEPASRMKHVDGLACESYVDPSLIEHVCLEESAVHFPPLPCDRCNPLRSADPSSMSARCDHCFDECNPWKEICAPNLGLNTVCPAEEVCPDYESSMEQCQRKDASDARTDQELLLCRRAAQLVCVDLREQCLCTKSVDVLISTGILQDSDTQFTCKSRQSLSISERVLQSLEGYQASIDASISDSRVPDALKDELRRGVDQWKCSQTPIDQHHLLLNAQIPGGNHKVNFPSEEEETKPMPVYNTIDYNKEGYILDINKNQKPDLLNECILFNCHLNPEICPWTTLDRDVPDDAVTDALLCEKSTTLDSSGQILPYGPAPNNPSRCDSGLQSQHSVFVDPEAVLAAYAEHKKNVPSGEEEALGSNRYPKTLELFLNSTYIAIPKNFVSDVFYMDRRYTRLPERAEQSKIALAPRSTDDFKPLLNAGEPGTFSLGGPFVNIFHAINDVISIAASYIKIAMVDPVGFFVHHNPGHPAAQFVQQAEQKLRQGIIYLRRFARALANSSILNFELRNPITGSLIARIDLGKRMAHGMYIVANKLEYDAQEFVKSRERLSHHITAGLERRISRVNEHIRTQWADTNVCMAESITTGYSRFYSVDRLIQFVREGFQIVVNGGLNCNKPALVDIILTQDVAAIKWDMTLVEDIGAAQAWAFCQIEKSITDTFFTKVLWPAFLKLFNRLMDDYTCSIVGLADDTRNTFASLLRNNLAESSSLYKLLEKLGLNTEPAESTLEQTCNEIASFMFAPSDVLTPISESALASSNIVVPGTAPPLNIAQFYQNARLLTQGTCWDGERDYVDLTPRDRIRATFGDFYFADKTGKNNLCPDHTSSFTQQINNYISVKLSDTKNEVKSIDGVEALSAAELEKDAVWGPLLKAGRGDYKPKLLKLDDYSAQDKLLLAKAQTPDAYRQFFKTNAQGIYPAQEFEQRPGPPIVKTLDRMMNAPDPYSPKRFTQTVWSKENLKFESKKLHLMNSVAFEPTYNTVQVNKLNFLGPGTPADETCYFDPYACKDDPARCDALKSTCNFKSKLSSPTSAQYGHGVYSLMIHGNELEADQLGSGTHDWRAPQNQFLTTDKIDTTGGGDEVLQRFFQESYLTKHDQTSLPGHRTCKDLNYNVMCNFIYDLDDPDDYCRQAHGWMYDWIDTDKNNYVPEARLTALDKLDEITWWPDLGLDEYDFVENQLTKDIGAWWYRYSHDNCIWLEDLDMFFLHGIGKISKSYVPDTSSLRYMPDLNAPRAETTLVEPVDQDKWSYSEHARDYMPSKRTFLLDGVRTEVTSLNDVLIADSQNSRVAPTRFALANKREHINRLYSKVMYRHHCPLDSGLDGDCDGIPDLCDNCPTIYNPTQNNTTNRAGYDFKGDACRNSSVPISACEQPVPSANEDENVATGCGDCNCTQVPTQPGHYYLVGVLCILGLIGLRRRNV